MALEESRRGEMREQGPAAEELERGTFRNGKTDEEGDTPSRVGRGRRKGMETTPRVQILLRWNSQG